MIEIAIDGNDGNMFLDKERPVFIVTRQLETALSAYREEVKTFFDRFGNEPVVIVRGICQDFSYNLFALALFIESCHVGYKTECVVFKVENTAEAIERYKPYVALTIAIKYVMRLCGEDAKTIYKEIGGMGYLGLEIKNDYLNNRLLLTLAGTEPLRRITASDTAEALSAAGILKALALVHTGASIEADIKISDQNPPIDEEAVINRIIAGVKPWIQ